MLLFVLIIAFNIIYVEPACTDTELKDSGMCFKQKSQLYVQPKGSSGIQPALTKKQGSFCFQFSQTIPTTNKKQLQNGFFNLKLIQGPDDKVYGFTYSPSVKILAVYAFGSSANFDYAPKSGVSDYLCFTWKDSNTAIFYVNGTKAGETQFFPSLPFFPPITDANINYISTCIGSMQTFPNAISKAQVKELTCGDKPISNDISAVSWCYEGDASSALFNFPSRQSGRYGCPASNTPTETPSGHHGQTFCTTNYGIILGWAQAATCFFLRPFGLLS